MIERRKHPTPDPNDKEDPGLAWEREHPDGDSRFGRIRGFQRQGGSVAPSSSHRGRPSSWVAVLLACAGFIAGGVGIVLGMSVPLLVIGGVLLVAAVTVALAFDMMGDVVLDSPRVESEEPHGTPLHRIKETDKQQD
nr:MULTISPECIES: DoxX family protein [unclassified Nocardiopsis]